MFCMSTFIFDNKFSSPVLHWSVEICSDDPALCCRDFVALPWTLQYWTSFASNLFWLNLSKECAINIYHISFHVLWQSLVVQFCIVLWAMVYFFYAEGDLIQWLSHFTVYETSVPQVILCPKCSKSTQGVLPSFLEDIPCAFCYWYRSLSCISQPLLWLCFSLCSVACWYPLQSLWRVTI